MDIEKELIRYFTKTNNGNSEEILVDLREIFRGQWEKLYIFRNGESTSRIEKITGKTLRKTESSSVLFVFMRNQNIEKSSEIFFDGSDKKPFVSVKFNGWYDKNHIVDEQFEYYDISDNNAFIMMRLWISDSGQYVYQIYPTDSTQMRHFE